jgi:PRTRC genetic system protein A
MDSRDATLQALTPTVMVPRFGAFEPLSQPGHRFLAASNGEYLELRRAWIYTRVQIAQGSVVAKPYGAVTECIDWLCPPIPLFLFERFARVAREHCPLEAAGWITWNQHSGQFAFREVDVRQASASYIHFDRPRLEEGEHLVVDLHSHGLGKAFFSVTDNLDDRGEVKLSIVFGHCQERTLSAVHRLCLLGKFVPMQLASATDNGLTFKVASLERKRYAMDDVLA